MMRKISILIIKFYQKAISPYLQSRCRFQPTCSEYSKEAIEKFGFIRGIILSFLRIIRCHPFGKHGYDPLPNKFLGGEKWDI